jgi:hypothetical protein
MFFTRSSYLSPKANVPPSLRTSLPHEVAVLSLVQWFSCVFGTTKMVAHVKSAIATCLLRLIVMLYVPATSCGHTAHGDDGDANNLFLTYVFSDMEFGIQFPKKWDFFAAR